MQLLSHICIDFRVLQESKLLNVEATLHRNCESSL